MKTILKILIAMTVLTISSNSQTIDDYFKSLPAKYSFDLTKTAKDSLLIYENYTIPGGDSSSTEVIGITEKRNDFIELHYGFSTGQRAFQIIQLRLFKKIDGTPLIVYSKFGGLQRAFDQHFLITYEYKKGNLLKTPEVFLPETIPFNSFIKQDIPESLRTKYKMLSTSYNLYPKILNTIEYVLSPQFLYENTEFEQWIKTLSIQYKWNGLEFELQ